MGTIQHAARTSFNLVMALVLAISLGLTGGLASTTRAWADDAPPPDEVAEPEATAASTDDASQALNYFSDPSDYGKFKIDTSQTPSDFNSDTSEDPMAGFECYEPQNLYVSYMNRYDYDKGQFSVADSLTDLATSDKSLDAMLENDNTVGGTKSLNANDWRHFQYHANNSCAVPNRNGDENLVAISNIYVGTSTGSGDADRRSRQEIQLWRFDKNNSNPINVGQANVDLVSGQKDDLERLDAIEQDGSLGLTALVGGDFDGKGAAELAVYVPDAKNPRIDFYGYINNVGFLKSNWSIPLSDLGAQFGGTFKNWYLPIVSLSTISRTDGNLTYDDIVVTASMPYTNYDGMDQLNQSTVMSIYSSLGNSSGALEKVFSYTPDDGSQRMRFASTQVTDLNDNGEPELILAGNRNTYDKNDKMGKMDASKNLVQMITYNESKQAYQYVWDSPQEVEALSNLNVTFEMCEPVAMASGKYLRDQNDALFLEGHVFALSSNTSDKLTNEADRFREGRFTSQFHMDLSGSNCFIKKAVSGNFAKKNLNSEQLIVQSGTTSSGRDKTVSYDVRWVYQEGSNLKQFDTDTNFIHNKKSHDNGTFLTLCTVEANTKNAFKFKLKSKAYGWSAPEAIAVLGSVPYWGELVGADDRYEMGTTSFGISSSGLSGEDHSWKLGGNFNISADLMFGAGFLGNGGVMGGGFDFGLAGSYAHSYYEAHEKKQSLTYQEKAGRDMVVCGATPIVTYSYEVWVPKFYASEDYCKQYNEYQEQHGTGGTPISEGWMGDCWVPFSITNTYDVVLGMLPLDDYNKAVRDLNTTDLLTIDKDKLFNHVAGDPTRYDSDMSAISNVDVDGIQETSQKVPIGPNGQSSIAASLEISKTSQASEGYDFAVSGDLAIAMNATLGFLAKAKLDARGSIGIEYAPSASYVDSTTLGAQFSTDLPQLPNDASYSAYQHNVQMAVWRTTLANKPFVVGYLVSGTDKQAAPKSPPRYPIVYSASDNEIAWAWSNDTTRRAGAYGVALPTSIGEWQVPSSNVVDGSTNMFVTKLKPEDTDRSQSIRFQAYDNENGDNPSALSRSLTGYATNSKVNPVFTTQPENALAAPGSTVTFGASAKSQRGEKIDYQWYRLDISDSLYYGTWEAIPGAKSPTLEIANVTADDDNTLYRVDAFDQTVVNGQLPSTHSNVATLKVDSNAVAPGNDANATTQTVPTISLRFMTRYAGADTGEMDAHGDEFFVPLYTSGRLEVTVKDADGNPCSGTVDMTPYFIPTGKDKPDYKMPLYTTLDSATGMASGYFSPTLDDPWAGASEPMIYQVKLTYKPADQDKDKWAETETRYTINYGKVDFDSKAHYLALDTDGALPGLDERDASSSDGAYKVAVAQNMKLPDLSPQMVGARFDGWYLDADFTTPLSFPFAPLTPGETTTVHGKWLQDEYNITYNLDGGTNDPGNPTVLTNDSPTVTLEDPTKTGYAFEGWYPVVGGTVLDQPVAHIPRGLTGDLTLQAKWSLIEYPIYYSAFAGTNPSGNPHSYTVHDEVTIQAPLFEGAIAGTSAWYADSLFSTKAAATIPKGSTGSVVLYGRADYPNPNPQPEPGPGPEVNPTTPAGGNGNGTALVSTGDATLPGIVTLASLLLLALVAAGTAAHRRRS